MKNKKELIKINNKQISRISFEFKNKYYELDIEGKNRRSKCLSILIDQYPKGISIHDKKFKDILDDTNKAMNEFINDEGYKDFVTKISKKNTKGRNIDYFTIELDKVCKHIDRGGVFERQKRRQPNKKVIFEILKKTNSCCAITGYKLYSKQQLKKDKNNFLSKMLELVFDHKIPLFKGGSDSIDEIDNWQILSTYVNEEKNKICKNCYEDSCENCCLAYPEKSSIIKPTNQNIKTLNIFRL